ALRGIFPYDFFVLIQPVRNYSVKALMMTACASSARRRWAAIACAAALAAAGCKATSGATSGGAPSGRGGGRGGAVNITTTAVQRFSVQREIDLSGTLLSP